MNLKYEMHHGISIVPLWSECNVNYSTFGSGFAGLGGALLSVDGTGQLSSTKIGFPQSCERTRGDGEKAWNNGDKR